MRIATRVPIERFTEIDRSIRAGEYPNAPALGRRLEVNARTIQRDIEFMRDRLGSPLAYDPLRNGYFYTDPTYRMGLWNLTEGELVAVFLAERVLRQWVGTPFGPDLERAFRKIVAGLGDEVRVDLDQLAAIYSTRTSTEVPFEPTLFRDLARAARDRRRVAFDYYTASRDDRARRVADPYCLAVIDGHWYLVAFCHLRQSVRMFAPGRITALEETGEYFDASGAFSLDAYLRDSMGVLRGEPGVLHRVVLRVTGLAIRYVRERIWHASQELYEEPEGSLRLTMNLSHLREVERFALSWGADCEVLEPPELRERVGAGLSQASARYASHSPNQERNSDLPKQHEKIAEPNSESNGPRPQRRKPSCR